MSRVGAVTPFESDRGGTDQICSIARIKIVDRYSQHIGCDLDAQMDFVILVLEYFCSCRGPINIVSFCFFKVSGPTGATAF